MKRVVAVQQRLAGTIMRWASVTVVGPDGLVRAIVRGQLFPMGRHPGTNWDVAGGKSGTAIVRAEEVVRLKVPKSRDKTIEITVCPLPEGGGV